MQVFLWVGTSVSYTLPHPQAPSPASCVKAWGGEAPGGHGEDFQVMASTTCQIHEYWLQQRCEQMHYIYQTNAWGKAATQARHDAAVTPEGLTPVSVKKSICRRHLALFMSYE